MENKLLTLVIPAYNVAKVLERNLNSALQADSLNNLEILIVNDGSKDNTLDIARDFEHKYPNIIRVINKENGGHGSTINAGIEQANGLYLRVVDGDDWLDTQGVNKALDYIQTQQNNNVHIDMLIFDYVKYNLDTHEKEIKVHHIEKYEIQDFDHVSGNVIAGFHSVVFLTEIMKKIKKIDEHCFYVDNEYVAYPIPFIKSICYLPWVLYVHSTGNDEQSTSTTSLIKNKDHVVVVLSSLLDFIAHTSCSDEKKRYLYSIADNLLTLYSAICFSLPLQQGRQLLKEIEDIIKKKSPNFANRTTKKRFNILRKFNYSFGIYMIVCVTYRIKRHGRIVW